MHKRHPFTKAQRLLKPPEFKAVRRQGKKEITRSFVVYTRPNTIGINRLGLSVGRHVGPATRRNRIKRLIREFFRLNLGPESEGGDRCGGAKGHKEGLDKGQRFDIHISVRKGARIKNLKDVQEELGFLLKK